MRDYSKEDIISYIDATVKKVESSWKCGDEDITLTIEEYIDLLMGGCQKYLEKSSYDDKNKTGNYGKYKQTLTIWIGRRGQ